MIEPEITLEISIKALEVYGVKPEIIKSMLFDLQETIKKYSTTIELSCDRCGCHPTVLYTTENGRLCKNCNNDKL